MSATPEVAEQPPVEVRKAGMRWRLIPASLLMIFGALELVLVAGIFGTLIAGHYADFKPFQEANSPELSRLSLTGMGLLAGLGLGWFIAGRLIWRRKYLVGFILAALCYPLGVYGTKWMLSSPVPIKPSVPDSNQRQMPPQRFDDRRRRAPPPLASIPKWRVDTRKLT